MALHLGPVHTGENNLFSFDAFQEYLRKIKTHAVVHIQGHIQWSASNPRTSIPCSLYINIQSRRGKQLLNLLAEIRTVSNAIYQGAVFNATKIMKMGAMTSSLAFQASTQILTWNRIGPFLSESTLGPGTRLVRFSQIGSVWTLVGWCVWIFVGKMLIWYQRKRLLLCARPDTGRTAGGQQTRGSGVGGSEGQ